MFDRLSVYFSAKLTDIQKSRITAALLLSKYSYE